MILKPATVTPLSALKLAEALLEAGLPPHVLQVITGYGSVIGFPLVKDQRVRMISFTGGVEAGKRIAQFIPPLFSVILRKGLKFTSKQKGQ